MSNIHPKLIEILVNQTQRIMLAMIVLSSIYLWIFSEFIPFPILLVWLTLQILSAIYRFYNAKMFTKYLKENNQNKIRKNEKYFIIVIMFQSCMWTVSSLLAIVYAPEPYELITLIIAIGVMTSAALSMSSLYKPYMIFFFSIIIPQMIILLYYGEHHHIGLFLITLIFIPATMVLSKTIHNNRIDIIKAHDDLEKNVNKLHKLSISDNLTNTYNRRYFFEVSQNLISIAKREDKKLSLIMIDIDLFKRVNDTYGHQAGDFILINLVKEIDKNLRESDIIARIGGEEFIILLNDTTILGANVIAEKIRSIVEKKTFSYNSISINITISIGISELNKENTSIENLYKQADKKLYEAKEKGRNRVVL